MNLAHTLQPTLWRSCRVLANRQRLRILSLLVEESKLTVTAVARRLTLPLPVASQYLRALEARGFLKARRRGSHVFYSLPHRTDPEALQPVVMALRAGFRQDPAFAEKVFRYATAFTHPRRIEIYRTLRGGNDSTEGLCAAIHASRFAVARHLAKLESRGFIRRQAGHWVVAPPREALACALVRQAAG